MTSGARRAVEHEEEEEEHMTTTTTSLALAQTFSQTCLGVVVEEVGSGVHVPAQEEEEERGSFGAQGGGGGGRPRQRRKTQTAPSQVELSVTLEELYTGAHKTLLVERTRTCTTCTGTGAKAGRQPKPCVRCNGQGETYHMRQMGPYIQRTPARCTACRGTGLKVRDQDA